MHLPPALVFAAASGAQLVLTRGRRPRGAALLGGIALASGALALAGSAVLALRRARTSIDPLHPEKTSTLVTDGPFALSRNPVYVGLAGLLLAHAVAYRSPSSLAPAAAFAVCLDRVQIPREERALAGRFGTAFERYRRRTPRWLIR